VVRTSTWYSECQIFKSDPVDRIVLDISLTSSVLPGKWHHGTENIAQIFFSHSLQNFIQ